MGKEICSSWKKKELHVDAFNSTNNLTRHPMYQSTVSVTSKDPSFKEVYNPIEHRDIEHPNSTFGTLLHLLKACLGSGILAMPGAFKNSGMVIGSIGTIIAGLICTNAVHILVKTSQRVCVDAQKPLMGYAETCGAAFTYGPKSLRHWGKTVKIIVDICMSVTYISILCVYVVFMASSVKQVIDVFIPDRIWSIQLYCLITFVPIVFACQIRNLKYLVPFSMFANVLVLVVFGITLYFIFVDLPDISDRETVANISQWPLFFSTVIFAMEGIGVVMPIVNEMEKPQQFLGCPGVLNISMVIIIGLYMLLGFFGYLKYGDESKGSVTLNLPQDNWVAQCAKLLMAVVVFCSYVLQFYVPMEMISRQMESKLPRKYEYFIMVVIRVLIALLTVGVAAAFPNLELVISFVGAIFLSTLGLLIPAIVHTVYMWDRDLGPCYYILIKNILLCFIALFALVSGTYASILGVLQEGES